MSSPLAAPSLSALWVAGALAVGGHAALGLSLWSARSSDEARLRPQPGITHAASRWTVSALTAKPAPQPTPASATPPRPDAQQLAPAEPVTAPAVAEPSLAADGTATTEPVIATTDADTPPISPDEANNPQARFHPRPELDVGPTPLAEVLIQFPVSSDDDGHRSGRFRLFIDEQGVVQDVLSLDAESTLTAAMAVAARSAFLGVRFEPGQKQGQAVRSRIDVEVSFDTQRLPAVASAAP